MSFFSSASCAYDVPQLFFFALVKESQGAGQALCVEEVVAYADHHIHMASFNQLLTDITILPGAVGCRGRHDESSAAMLVRIGVEVGDLQVIGVAELLVFVDAWQTERKPSRALHRLGVHLIDVKWRVSHHIS